MKYLKFNLPKLDVKPHLIQRFVMNTLYFLKITANPDFDKKINDVSYWLVEFDEENIPNREIGLDENDNVILKMPYKRNYGFWTDNQLLYDDFISRFSAVEISERIFEAKWNGVN